MTKHLEIENHIDRVAIEEAILRGDTIPKIAKQFSVSPNAVHTYRKGISSRLEIDHVGYSKELILRAQSIESELQELLAQAKEKDQQAQIIRILDRLIKLIETESKVLHAAEMERRLNEVEVMIKARGVSYG